MDLETGDILWLPDDLRVPHSSGGWFWNPFRLTGHVAMVFFKDGEKKDIPDDPVHKDHAHAVPYVVEAVKNAKNPNPKLPRISQVREIPYHLWALNFRTFWHGRIKKPSTGGLVDLSPEEQIALVTEALSHLRKPYSGWRGPSLDCYTRFSCSKLVLVAAYDALKMALDDHQPSDDPQRRFPSVAAWLRKSPYIFDVPPPPPPPP